MNINRDYLIINDVKKSNIKLDNGSIFFYITDKNTQNIFVNLVINISNNDLIQKYANIENAEDYTLTMNIVKPSNTYKVIEGKLHDKENAIFEFNLSEDCCDEIGPYRCELLTKCNINDHEEITTSNKLSYKVKSGVLNDLDDIVKAPEYPLVIQLFDKLSDIEQYEEDRRANELARQLAEEQRQAKHNELVADMTDSIQAMDDKVVEVDNRITAKESTVDKLVTDTKADIDEYKVAKDQEIDEYKTTKDTEINNAITAQDNKIDTAIATQDNKIDTAIKSQNDRIAVVENNDVAQDNRLDVLENKDVLHESRLDAIEVKNQQQDNRLDIVENKNTQQDNRLDVVEAIDVAQNNRLNEIEAIDVAQNTRLDAIEVKNQQQDDRLLDIEKVNKRQDMDLKCLFAESKNNMIDVTEEGNRIYLQNSTIGYTLIDEIKGNTLVNCNKEPDKEIILNGNINTQGYSNVTLAEGVDGGLVDVALEGNTMVNVCDQKDPVAITKSYTVETGNHVALQGEYDGKCRPVVTGNTLWIDNDTGDVLTAFDESKNLRLQSSFEDKVVTQEMVDAGEELAENLGKYKADYVISKEDGTVGFTKTFYLNSPLLEGDTIEQQGDNVVHVHRYGKVVLDGSKDESWVSLFTPEGGTTSYSNLKIDNLYANNGIISVLCDKLPSIAGSNYDYNKQSIYAWNTNGNLGDLYVQINSSKLSTVNMTGFRSYLQQNPITVVYKLASPQYEVISQNDTILCDSYTNGHLDVDSVVPIEKVDFLHFEEELAYLYPSTQYTVQFASDKAITIDIALGGTQLLAQSIVYGINRISITTPSELVNNKLIIDGAGANISEVVVTDTDREFRYFEGMKSVGECEELEITSANSDNSLSNTQQLTHEPLRGTRDAKDRYVLIDGKWFIERKCASVILDGSEKIQDVTTWGAFSDKTIQFRLGYNQFKDKKVDILCDNFISEDGNLWAMDTEGIKSYTVDTVDIRINKTKLSTQNLAGFRQWLQQNPTTVVYKLATPVYEPIDYNPLEVYSGTTHITTNSVIPTNITVKNHGFNCLLKPSTTYTVSSNLGLNTVTTPSTLTEDCLRFMDTDTSDVTTMKDVLVLEGDWTTKADLIPANFSGIESTFEQEYNVEKGKYKVNVKVVNEDRTKENNITFYINEPLRGIGDIKDRVYVKDDKVVVQRNCGIRPYEDGDFGTYPTDKVNTVYPLAEPTYEEVEYNDTKLFIESFKNSTLSYNSNVPVTSTVHYSYSVPIVDTVAQTANVTDQQDSMIIDLATQCAILEMMLM